jgi:phosphohistidine phosphatase SixA
MPPESPNLAAPDQPAMLYGAGAIAAYLGMTEHACRHLIAESVIPTFKIGARICARRETIDSWLVDQEVRARQTAIRVIDDLPRRPGVKHR